MAAFADEEPIEELTKEERNALVSHILLSSPPGEIKDVLSGMFFHSNFFLIHLRLFVFFIIIAIKNICFW